ncbi:MAG: sulfotransferase [Pseudomonadota bacterium]|nr:sulfotransferase [Pseudomonadota bacterium]
MLDKFPTRAPGASAVQEMNTALAPVDDEATAAFSPKPPHPVCIIIAPPRGGSTLLHQMIISTFNIGYASNILARFWDAPYFGAQLHSQIANPEFISTCQSRFGIGAAPEDPHEWTWFWQKHLLLSGNDHYVREPGKIAWDRLGQKLTALQTVFEAPLIFDNVLALNALPYLLENFPTILPVVLERDPYYVCSSVINLRLNRLGDLAALKFHLPRNAEELRQIEDPIEQIVVQVRSLLSETEELLRLVPAENRIHIAYEELKTNPQAQLDRFGQFLAGHGSGLMRKDVQVIDPEPNRNQAAYVHPDHREKLDHYFAKYF